MRASQITFTVGVALASMVMRAQAQMPGMLSPQSDLPSERRNVEVQDGVIAGKTVYSLTAEPASWNAYPTWRLWPWLTAETDSGTISVPSYMAYWSSSNPSVAPVDGNGMVTALAVGSAIITVSYGGAEDTIDITVAAPIHEPEVEALDTYLTTPAPCHLYEMPVAIIRYLPTTNGVNITGSLCDYWGTVTQLKARIDELNIHTKFMLEEGSRFRDYGQGQAPPALGYRVVQMISVYEPMPLDTSPGHRGGDWPQIFLPDYYSIVDRFNGRHLVEDLGVKEIWIWGYHYGQTGLWESNMASPTGDISNSFRWEDDLPVYNKTYVAYHYNFTRDATCSSENHTHQIEHMFTHVNGTQDGNEDLFWKKFVGKTDAGEWGMGRSGWTHMPPNTTVHYDRCNHNLVSSDIKDWTPLEIGTHELVNVHTWEYAPYVWPYGNPPAWDLCTHHWHMFWMQSIPGRGNGIPYGSRFMSNWWTFIGDWDNAIAAISPDWGLHALQPALGLCGDECMQVGEECDDGNAIDNDGCTNSCTLPRCGDGIVQVGEECDDGNAIDNDGCTNSCTLPEGAIVGSIVAWGSNYYGQTSVPAPNADFMDIDGGWYHSLGLRTDGSIVAWGSNEYGQTDVPAPNNSFLAVASGKYHSLGLKSNGSILGWGYNDNGQTSIPGPNADFIAVAGGNYHSVGLKVDRSIVAWGDNALGQTNIPEPNSDFITIAVGGNHSLGLKANGSIVAWGSNSSGQTSVPEPNSDFVAIAAGEGHSLGVKSNGTIVAWGLNNWMGQCNVPPPNSGFAAVACGVNHSLGLKADGSIVAWGYNSAGQTTVPSPNSGFLALAAGGSHSLALKALAISPPQLDPSGITKSRFISFSVPAAATAAGVETAIRVTLTSLHHVDPPYTGGASVPFTSFEGQVRWVGPPGQYVESSSNPTMFYAASLQCTPHYQDWSTVGLLHVTGSAIVPSSVYEVENVAASCQGIEDTCTAVSVPLTVATTRWGDVEIPYNPPDATAQPDLADVGALVNKFRSAPGAPIKARALLAGDDTFGNISTNTLSLDFNFSHIAACVDAFRGKPYPFAMEVCP